MTVRRWLGVALALVLVAGLGVFGWRAFASDSDVVERAASSLSSATRPDFPVVDEARLSPVRARVIDVVRQAYQNPHDGEYYAQGNTEPWCADFVSWTMHTAGVRLRNPNSGSWRIPGVSTLTEYYQSAGRFRGPSYLPHPGDVVLYEAPNRFKQHTNIVVKVDGTTVTTVGGNEPPTSISINSFDAATTRGIVGYGVIG